MPSDSGSASQGHSSVGRLLVYSNPFITLRSQKKAKTKRKNLVDCSCTKCGPGSEKIHPDTKKDHLARDKEEKRKKKLPTATAVPGREFMEMESRRRKLPQSTAPGSDVEMGPGEHLIDHDMEMPSRSPTPPLDISRQVDSEMPDVNQDVSPSVLAPSHPSAQSLPDASSSPAAPVPTSDPNQLPNLLRPRANLAEESPFWFWQLILLAIAWCHLHFHAPHRCCDLLLKVLRNIFICLGTIKSEDKVPVTLTTTFKRLGINEDFEIRAIRPRCRRAYPENAPGDLMCSECQIPLFNTAPPSTSAPVSLLASSRPKSPPKPRPVLQSPHLLPSTQIVELLNRDGNEIACESYLTRKPIPGKMSDIMDGEICQSLKGPDGRKFFDIAPDRPDPDELRIGLCFGEDGFSFTRTKDAGTHTTGAASFCVAALPHHRRYRPRNLLLTKLSPGPHGETSDEFQRGMAATVADLLMLYDEGIFVKTPKYPQGRRVRIILIAVCCDHPAMCVCGGFSDHRSKKFPCTRCNITHDDIQTAAGMKVDAFTARDGEQHRRESAEYAKIPEDDKKARDTFASTYGTRYYEFSHLSYFDPVRQIIIDPMHCIFLGVVKTQWLDAWIKDPAALRKSTALKPREIDQIHEYLQALEMPSWVARLPSKVGYPAGGNLTSDEWKGMLLVFLPLILPHIWTEWFPVAEADHDKAMKRWEAKEKARKNRIADGTATAKERKNPTPDPKPIRMFKNDPDLLLKLATCCKILLAGTIDVATLPRAQQLLEDYLAGFLANHPDLVKPNFHYITHIFKIIRDFGPVYGFWTFLFERLNKLLKSYDTNNHGDGELELTFFREFHRDANLREVLSQLAQREGREGLTPEEQCVAANARLILATDGDVRGTLASMTTEVEDLCVDLDTKFSLGLAVHRDLPPYLQRSILEYYNSTYPTTPIIARAAEIGSNTPHFFLHGSVTVHSYFILDGRRIASSTSMTDAASSLVQMDAGGTRYVGQIYNILTHHQPGLERPQWLLDIRWMRRCLDVDMSPWQPYPELEVFAWDHGKFLRDGDIGPGRIVPISAVLSQACRLTIDWKQQVPVDGLDSDDEESDVDVDTETETQYGTVLKIWFTAGLSRDVIVV
ncbi:hypothetical protein B0H16DRAFT_1811810 [Mycena metata]|uniref:Uncharacterized protein n=1 Tax=Mycena metata TaxID=1033252 RepID=A0AAD7MDV3_9AGAR|nr:hypothetical protein B0H16DRAFT_1811810 [Mycena metata]